MKLSSNTILITGGGSGIGLALAERFLKSGSKVIICGRDLKKMEDACKKNPGLISRVCDISNESERESLCNWVFENYGDTNVLINNAGIQQRVKLADNPEWKKLEQELEINLLAHIHLALLFVPRLLKARDPVLMNVTSGLAFAPLAAVPVYCATKSAMHSITLSLRYQLKDTPVKVTEIMPPAVNTDLGGKGLHDFGTPLNEFADAVMTQIEEGKQEITYGFSAKSNRASKEELDEIFNQMNSR